MDTDTKLKIENWLRVRLTSAAASVGCAQPEMTCSYRDTDIFKLQRKIGSYFTFHIDGILTEVEILAAYRAAQMNTECTQGGEGDDAGEKR